MKKEKMNIDVLFEVSWEVCNKVGGIYTVLSTHAKTLQVELKDNLIFIGPDLMPQSCNPLFKEDKTLLKDWVESLENNPLIKVRVGRWQIPGTPIAILVDFQAYYSMKNEIYAMMWEEFRVDSLHAYGDYDESQLFAYATGKVVESYYNFFKLEDKEVVYQGHEWMTGMGLLYIKHTVPAIATVFTTHATSVGRSIASNYKPLYDYLPGYSGDQMARELNVEGKHSIEKVAALESDCFTTVSDITAIEATQLLERKPDVILNNGFENDFVPKGAKFTSAANRARKKMIAVAQKVVGCDIADDVLIVGTSGRFEMKNKGLDVFIDAINKLANSSEVDRPILAFIFVPAWVGDPRQDLQYRLSHQKKKEIAPLEYPYITHWLHNMDNDAIISMIRERHMNSDCDKKVNIVYVPCYLNGKDGIFNLDYYDVLIGQDLTAYPSYYEPWGYTPLESIAFKIPTITTSLSGFGRWVMQSKKSISVEEGVEVIERNDNNYGEVVDKLAEAILNYSKLNKTKVTSARNKASRLADRALWDKFIINYYKAYKVALKTKTKRNN